VPVINAQTIGNAYPASPGTGTNALGGVWNSRGGWFSITGASAYVQLQYGDLANGHWTEEILLGNGAFVVVPPNCRGMQFRNAVANVVATVTAQIAEGDEPPLAISSFGQIGIVSVASLNFQRNDVAVATEPTADFMDAAGVLTWTLADDVANTRVRITPAFTSPALFPGSVGVGGNAGDTAISRAAAGVLGVTTAFTTGPTSAAAGGGGTAGVYVGASISQVAAAAGTTVQASSVTTDTQPRYAQTAAGTITWGAGGAAATDTTLNRVAAGVLQVGVTGQGGRWAAQQTAATNMAFSCAVDGDTVARYQVFADGTIKWGPGSGAADVTWNRTTTGPASSAVTGLTSGQPIFQTGAQGFTYVAAAGNNAFMSFLAAADANPAFKAQTAGQLFWGGGGASAVDLEIARATNSPSGSGHFLELVLGDGIGYGVGTGGTVTQLTSLSTGVTLNKPSGQITLFTTAWANGGVGNFVLTNSVIGAQDTVVVSFNTTIGGARFLATVTAVAAGSCTIGLWNLDALTASGAAKLNFAVIKGSTT
jgi:hypothetical protein